MTSPFARIRLLVSGLLLIGLPVAAETPPPGPGTLSLEECIAIALETHPVLRSADAQVRAAEFRVPQVDAAIAPHATAEYGFSRRQSTLANLIAGPDNDLLMIEETFNYQVGRFALSQLLFDFGRTLGKRRAARAEVEAARADLETAEHVLTLAVKRSYYDLTAADRLLEVAEDNEARARQYLATAGKRHRAGLVPRFDVMHQEVQAANAELATLAALDNIALARENLRDAMGLTDPISFAPDPAVLAYVPVQVDEAAALAQAYDRRPEIRSLRARTRAQEQRLAALQRNYWPSVTGRADYTLTGETPSQEGWLVGALVELSLFDGGLTPSRIGEARARLLQLNADEKRVRQRILLEVRESLLKLRQGAERLPVSLRATEAAAERLRVAETRYGNGVSIIDELANSQAAYSATWGHHVRLLASYRLAIGELERSIGGPLPAPQSPKDSAGK